MISLVIPTLLTLAFEPGQLDRYRPGEPGFTFSSASECREMIGELAQVFRYSSDASGIVYRVLPKGAEVRAEFKTSGRSVVLNCTGPVFSIRRDKAPVPLNDGDVTSGIISNETKTQVR